MGDCNKFGKPTKLDSAAASELSGGQAYYPATETIRGIPYEFPSVDRMVGVKWTNPADGERSTRKFIAICRNAGGDRVSDGGVSPPETLGLDYRGYIRNPGLRFSLPVIEQQLAECLVDMTVNRDANLPLLLASWTGSYQILSMVIVRAMIHPASKAFSEQVSCNGPFLFACFAARKISESQVERELALADAIRSDAELLVRSEIIPGVGLINAIGMIWSKCQKVAAMNPVQRVCLLVAALAPAAALLAKEPEQLFDGKRNGLAEFAAQN